MDKIKLSELANAIQAYKNCIKNENNEWMDKWDDAIQQANDKLPSGSGLDSGCKIVVSDSNRNKIVIAFSFHHMDQAGSYDGWTDHQLIITPAFIGGFDWRITGRNRNEIKQYLYDLFNDYFEV